MATSRPLAITLTRLDLDTQLSGSLNVELTANGFSHIFSATDSVSDLPQRSWKALYLPIPLADDCVNVRIVKQEKKLIGKAKILAKTVIARKDLYKNHVTLPEDHADRPSQGIPFILTSTKGDIKLVLYPAITSAEAKMEASEIELGSTSLLELLYMCDLNQEERIRHYLTPSVIAKLQEILFQWLQTELERLPKAKNKTPAHDLTQTPIVKIWSALLSWRATKPIILRAKCGPAFAHQLATLKSSNKKLTFLLELLKPLMASPTPELQVMLAYIIEYMDKLVKKCVKHPERSTKSGKSLGLSFQLLRYLDLKYLKALLRGPLAELLNAILRAETHSHIADHALTMIKIFSSENVRDILTKTGLADTLLQYMHMCSTTHTCIQAISLLTDFGLVDTERITTALQRALVLSLTQDSHSLMLGMAELSNYLSDKSCGKEVLSQVFKKPEVLSAVLECVSQSPATYTFIPLLLSANIPEQAFMEANFFKNLLRALHSPSQDSIGFFITILRKIAKASFKTDLSALQEGLSRANTTDDMIQLVQQWDTLRIIESGHEAGVWEALLKLQPQDQTGADSDRSMLVTIVILTLPRPLLLYLVLQHDYLTATFNYLSRPSTLQPYQKTPRTGLLVAYLRAASQLRQALPPNSPVSFQTWGSNCIIHYVATRILPKLDAADYYLAAQVLDSVFPFPRIFAPTVVQLVSLPQLQIPAYEHIYGIFLPLISEQVERANVLHNSTAGADDHEMVCQLRDTSLLKLIDVFLCSQMLERTDQSIKAADGSVTRIWNALASLGLLDVLNPTFVPSFAFTASEHSMNAYSQCMIRPCALDREPWICTLPQVALPDGSEVEPPAPEDLLPDIVSTRYANSLSWEESAASAGVSPYTTDTDISSDTEEDTEDEMDAEMTQDEDDITSTGTDEETDLSSIGPSSIIDPDDIVMTSENSSANAVEDATKEDEEPPLVKPVKVSSPALEREESAPVDDKIELPSTSSPMIPDLLLDSSSSTSSEAVELGPADAKDFSVPQFDLVDDEPELKPVKGKARFGRREYIRRRDSSSSSEEPSSSYSGSEALSESSGGTDIDGIREAPDPLSECDGNGFQLPKLAFITDFTFERLCLALPQLLRRVLDNGVFYESLPLLLVFSRYLSSNGHPNSQNPQEAYLTYAANILQERLIQCLQTFNITMSRANGLFIFDLLFAYDLNRDPPHWSLSYMRSCKLQVSEGRVQPQYFSPMTIPDDGTNFSNRWSPSPVMGKFEGWPTSSWHPVDTKQPEEKGSFFYAVKPAAVSDFTPVPPCANMEEMVTLLVKDLFIKSEVGSSTLLAIEDTKTRFMLLLWIVGSLLRRQSSLSRRERLWDLLFRIALIPNNDEFNRELREQVMRLRSFFVEGSDRAFYDGFDNGAALALLLRVLPYPPESLYTYVIHFVSSSSHRPPNTYTMHELANFLRRESAVRKWSCPTDSFFNFKYINALSTAADQPARKGVAVDPLRLSSSSSRTLAFLDSMRTALAQLSVSKIQLLCALSPTRLTTTFSPKWWDPVWKETFLHVRHAYRHLLKLLHMLATNDSRFAKEIATPMSAIKSLAAKATPAKPTAFSSPFWAVLPASLRVTTSERFSLENADVNRPDVWPYVILERYFAMSRLVTELAAIFPDQLFIKSNFMAILAQDAPSLPVWFAYPILIGGGLPQQGDDEESKIPATSAVLGALQSNCPEIMDSLSLVLDNPWLHHFGMVLLSCGLGTMEAQSAIAQLALVDPSSFVHDLVLARFSRRRPSIVYSMLSNRVGEDAFIVAWLKTNPKAFPARLLLALPGLLLHEILLGVPEFALWVVDNLHATADWSLWATHIVLSLPKNAPLPDSWRSLIFSSAYTIRCNMLKESSTRDIWNPKVMDFLARSYPEEWKERVLEKGRFHPFTLLRVCPLYIHRHIRNGTIDLTWLMDTLESGKIPQPAIQWATAAEQLPGLTLFALLLALAHTTGSLTDTKPLIQLLSRTAKVSRDRRDTIYWAAEMSPPPFQSFLAIPLVVLLAWPILHSTHQKLLEDLLAVWTDTYKMRLLRAEELRSGKITPVAFKRQFQDNISVAITYSLAVELVPGYKIFAEPPTEPSQGKKRSKANLSDAVPSSSNAPDSTPIPLLQMPISIHRAPRCRLAAGFKTTAGFVIGAVNRDPVHVVVDVPMDLEKVKTYNQSLHSSETSKRKICGFSLAGNVRMNPHANGNSLRIGVATSAALQALKTHRKLRVGDVRDSWCFDLTPSGVCLRSNGIVSPVALPPECTTSSASFVENYETFSPWTLFMDYSSNALVLRTHADDTALCLEGVVAKDPLYFVLSCDCTTVGTFGEYFIPESTSWRTRPKRFAPIEEFGDQ